LPGRPNFRTCSRTSTSSDSVVVGRPAPCQPDPGAIGIQRRPSSPRRTKRRTEGRRWAKDDRGIQRIRHAACAWASPRFLRRPPPFLTDVNCPLISRGCRPLSRRRSRAPSRRGVPSLDPRRCCDCGKASAFPSAGPPTITTIYSRASSDFKRLTKPEKQRGI
jgi:hypothetical protein